MRYSADEKLEIIRLVEASHLGIRLTLDRLGIAKTTFYRWYERYQTDGIDGLCDKSPKPSHIWNRISDEVRAQIVDLALDHPTLSSRELAVKFTDERGYYVSESSVLQPSHVRSEPL